MDISSSTITLTLSESSENHVGMQKIGEIASSGFSRRDLRKAQQKFEKAGAICELIELNDYLPEEFSEEVDDAYVLLIRQGVDILLSSNTANDLFEEQSNLDVDKKAFMYGRVVNKHARWNLCFDDVGQEPDYENKKGRIIPYSEVPLLRKIRRRLPRYVGEKAKKLTAEGNYYYDVTKCGIGFHGDGERLRVIGIRMGCSLPLHYQWFHKGKPIGKRAKLMLNHGDMYIMSEKATGNDWKSRNSVTLRHAAGAKKFLKIK